ncbi:MAG: hypothetical protein H8D22_03295 [Candidatus Cloacimonetes bacterium]|nr:hypothetical protein [Candidatus Cloacimonadota bacterium]MBL7124340.1 hypothetical protein [Actinomycetota bacterium]
MKAEDLILQNDEIGTKDFLEKKEWQGKIIGDIPEYLYEKYKEKIFAYVKRTATNIIDEKERIPLMFYYTDKKGSSVNKDGKWNILDPSEKIGDIMSLYDIIHWRISPVGARLSSLQAFGNHAVKIVVNPKYRNWKYLEENRPGLGIYSVGPDNKGIRRTWKIKPSANYPDTPPIVVSLPPYTKDPCWFNGILHYTTYKNKGGTPWKDMAEKCNNPLLVLVVELFWKYRIGV